MYACTKQQFIWLYACTEQQFVGNLRLFVKDFKRGKKINQDMNSNKMSISLREYNHPSGNYFKKELKEVITSISQKINKYCKI